LHQQPHAYHPASGTRSWSGTPKDRDERAAIRRTGAARARYESRVSNHVNLTPQEESLIAESHPEALVRMDAKALKELQSRLRQAREKNFSLLRRQGAARVEAQGARGAAQPANEKREEKIEVFDDALARVTERLETVGDE
jgi:hypothetical protein